MATYNGHKNRNHWNVSLWLNNDESLYRMALHIKRTQKTLDDAAKEMLRTLNEDFKQTHTPDDVRWTVSTIKAAMRDM